MPPSTVRDRDGSYVAVRHGPRPSGDPRATQGTERSVARARQGRPQPRPAFSQVRLAAVSDLRQRTRNGGPGPAAYHRQNAPFDGRNWDRSERSTRLRCRVGIGFEPRLDVALAEAQDAPDPDSTRALPL